MSIVSLAAVIFRRYFWYAMFVVFGVAFLLYVLGGVIQYSQHVHEERHTLEMINADVIAPKGSSIEHLRRLLRLEVFQEPALIPSQLYTTLTTQPPEGLQLTPVFFWGHHDDTPVIAADLKLQDILGTEFRDIANLGEREVILGKNAATKYKLNVGDSISLTTGFGDLTETPYTTDFKVKAIHDLGVWNGAVLSSLSQAESILKEVKFTSKQIWNHNLLSYIFVTGPERWLQETKHLVDKRTVAQDLRLSTEVPGLLKLSGIDEHLELEVLIFALLSSIISLFAFLAIWLPLLARTYRKLIRSGYSTHKLLLCFQLLGLFLLFLAAGLSALASHYHPLL